MTLVIHSSRSFAQDAKTQAAELSDHAFTMLNSINASSAKAGPMLVPTANLAGDAQTLSTALGAHDKASASGAMAAVLSDRDKIEAAAKVAGGQYPEQWTIILEKIAALEKQVPASKGAIARSGVPESHAPVAPPAGEKTPAAPKIEIASRVFKGATVRVKGFLEGTELKSAGIFDGEKKTRDVEVASVPGEQRINFDFSIEQPSPTQSIRVTDSYGREATALVEPNPAGVGAMKGSEELIEVDSGATASTGEAGPLADGPLASAGPAPRHGNNTAEIARPADALSPSRRHMEANSSLAPLTNVQINILDAEELMSAPGTVEVVGQIAGPGVRHAGVYVNGRLAKVIPISAGAYSSFDLTFPMPAGSDAKIRAYGNGNNFVEASIDTVGGGSGMTEYGNTPMYAAPYGTYPAYPPSPYYRPNPYAYANPYAPGYNPYAPNPYPYGYPPPYGTPPPTKPWYSKLFH
ncbi:MAG TPA: hypothetical protein VGH32_08650 [Pirellulales bacterium]